MSRRPSIMPGSDALNMPAKLRNLYAAPKPTITIDLKNKRSVYTTLDQLDGVVNVTASVDTPFDNLSVEFIGTSRTYVERLTTAAAISGRSEAFHQFLKLQQPRLEQHFPADRILRAGQTYRFPFVFVVPEHLLPRICQHTVAHQSVRHAHLQLPPTLGDRDSSMKNGQAHKDMVPEMASIRYGIFVSISSDKTQRDAAKRAFIASKARRVRLLPVSDEQPPLDITHDDPQYTLRRERLVRKGVLQGKLGTLVMEAAQPPSMRLRAHRSDNVDQQPSAATIMLRFDPVDEKSSPPRLGGLTSKLKVCTFFASTARPDYPVRQSAHLDVSQGVHSEQLHLSSRCMANVDWTKCVPNKISSAIDGTVPNERRDSVQSLASTGSCGTTPSPSAAYKGGAYYTAKIVVPINLPTNKSFVPTFHTCLISRTYQLKLELGLHTASFGGTVDLRLPLQMSCASPNGDDSPRRGSVESTFGLATDEDDVGEFFEPRALRIPSQHFIGQSRLVGSAETALPSTTTTTTTTTTPRSSVDFRDEPPQYYSFASSQSRAPRVPVF